MSDAIAIPPWPGPVHRQVLKIRRQRIALENAVSVASVLLLTEATLMEVPEPRTEGRQPVDVE